jgi:hypothetical protein
VRLAILPSLNSALIAAIVLMLLAPLVIGLAGKLLP